MKKALIFLAIIFLILGCSTGTQTSEKTQTNENYQQDTNTVNENTEKPNEEMKSGTQSSEENGALNVYMKDAIGFVESVEVTVERVEAEKLDKSVEVLASGKQKVLLDKNTTTLIASKELRPEFYNEIRIILGESSIVTEVDGTKHNAIVNNRLLIVGIGQPIQKNKTLEIIADVELKNAVKQVKGKMFFDPKRMVGSKTVLTSGLNIKNRGVISSEAEVKLGTSHSQQDVEIVGKTLETVTIPEGVYI